MKAIIIFLLLFFIIIEAPTVCAVPVIENVSVNPQNPWLGDDVLILLNCYDDNSSISGVSADITGPSQHLPDFDFTLINGNYTLLVDGSYLDRRGDYTVLIVCENYAEENTTTETGFTVSELTTSVNEVLPETIYTDDIVEIFIDILKDDIPITDDVSFELEINDENIDLIQNPAYYIGEGWKLRIYAPDSDANYELHIVSIYDTKNIEDVITLQVENPVVFELITMNNEFVLPDTEIELTLKAEDRGTIIPITENILDVTINNQDASINDITADGNQFIVNIEPLSLDPGKYELKLELDYGGGETILRDIIYPLSISGTIRDRNDNAIDVDLMFRKGSKQTVLHTNSEGEYSGYVEPGLYDIELVHTKVSVKLLEVDVDDYADSIKYDYHLGGNIPGIIVAGFFVFETALSFDTAEIEMKYDDRNILDETELEIYRCSNWNHGQVICNSEWQEVNGEIDTIRNTATMETGGLSAFIIGAKEGITINANLDKSVYNLNDIIQITGLTFDSSRTIIPNVSLTLLKESEILDTVFSDEQGIFSFEIFAPDEEGTHILEITADKNPYVHSSITLSFEIERNKKINLLVPDRIRLNRGNNVTMEFSVINTGQIALEDIVLSLSGVPDGYYAMETAILPELDINEEIKIPIVFSIPVNAQLNTYSALFRATIDDVATEANFALTILEQETANQTDAIEPSQSFEFPLPNIILLAQDSFISLAIIAIIIFGTAFVLRRRKTPSSTGRDEVKLLLSGIRDELGKAEIETTARRKKTRRKQLYPKRRRSRR